MIDSNKFDLPQMMLDSALELPPTERATILLKLMEFIYPKRKAVDIKSESSISNPIVRVVIPSNSREA